MIYYYFLFSFHDALITATAWIDIKHLYSLYITLYIIHFRIITKVLSNDGKKPMIDIHYSIDNQKGLEYNNRLFV